MNDNQVELKSVADMLGKKFFIPNYQRGYRWKKQQVKDLLDDIEEFIELQKKSEKNDGFYCIQPLVVKENIAEAEKTGFINELKNIEPDKDVLVKAKEAINKYTKWEVIDGQQRLTTIFILLSYLGEKEPYKLEYETRKGTESDSADFLNNIANKTEKDCTNIDFFHMYNAYKAIENWFSANTTVDKSGFKEILLKQVKFIWYESTDEDPIKVFTRLNIGKISLTNAELIKALFLNRSNFSEKEYADIRLKQQEIASEWDKIEYTLQNDEFWLFLNQLGYDKPTRIDMIFDLICEQDILEMYHKQGEFDKTSKENLKKACGSDQYKTFRYFYNFFKLMSNDYPKILQESKKSKIEFCWSKVKNVFQIFEEWYNDLELYHYVGYLVDQGEKIYDRIDENKKNIPGLLTLWTTAKSKQDFIGKLKEKIKGKISNCNVLTQQYEMDKCPKKTQCRPLLLLHNIQTVINQNKNSEDAYKLSVFYKFPFHLYKEESWDVEHIDSNTENNLEKPASQKEWLQDILLDIPEDVRAIAKEKIKNKETDVDEEENSNVSLCMNILIFINPEIKPDNNSNQINGEHLSFEDLRIKIENNPLFENPDRLQENKDDINEKNLIWNYCLLDSSTNRSYGNALFSAKRRIIIEKDKGTNGAIAFIPPCTKNVFLKYYNSSTNVLRAWTKADAEAYLININTVLSEAGFISDQKTKIDGKMNEGENK